METTKPDVKTIAGNLVERLRQARRDRGLMADLRCAWNMARVYRAWPFLGQLGLIEDQAAHTVAGGFAYHPKEAEGRSFGAACRALSHAGAEQRFYRLLSASRREVCQLVRPLILAMRSEGIGLDYGQLYTDLRLWSDPVRQRWAVDFWRPVKRTSDQPEPEQPDEEPAASASSAPSA